MNRSCLAVLVLGAFGPAEALAQDRDNARYRPDDASHWSFETGAGTDNRSKGASKSGGDAYVFGEVQWTAGSGFYADAEFETIDSSGSHMETEVEVGWQVSGAGLEFDTSVSRKWRPGANAGVDDAAWEYQFDMIRDFGAVDARLRIEHSPDGLGSTGVTTWVETRLRWPVADRLQASVTVGRREQEDAPDYTGWNAGLVYALTGTTDLDLRWHGTDAGETGSPYDDALVGSVLISF